MGWIRMGCLAQTKSFHVKIILLDKQELIQEVQGGRSGQDLLDTIYKHLNLIETAYFGLRYLDNTNQTHWLDPSKKVSQQIKGVSPITLYLGVKFYAADPCKLVEEITRYQFFLQVKLDILQGRLPVAQDLAVELAALALQSELGDQDPGRHSGGYVSEFRFFSSQSEDIEAKIEEQHRRLLGIQPAQAENRYLEKVKWLDMYGVDLHPVIGEDNIEYFLGLTPSGIIVLRNRNKVGNYFWPRISKIYFKGKYFMLRVRDKNNEDSTYGFETPSRQACKHLWKCCVEHHAFFRLVQVSPAFTSSGLLGVGSRLRGSGRSEKDSSLDITRRNPPNFTRVPSQRYSRRSRSSLSHIDTQHRSSSNTEPQHRSSSILDNQHRTSTSNANDAIRTSNSNLLEAGRRSSLPRNSSLQQSLPPGLDGVDRSNSILLENGEVSLQSLQYLESKGLFGSRSRRSGDHEHSEIGLYKKRGSRRGGSDEESEASGASMASTKNHRRGNESGSESESSRSARKNHRGRRRRHGSYKLVETGVTSPEARGGVALATVRKSGYVNSGAETESEIVSSLRRNKRRQRSRSRSPSDARARLPSELTKHFEYTLVEPPSPSLLKEIPFTQVETDKPIKVRYSGTSGRRSRHNSSGSAARRRINVETEEKAMSLVQAPTYQPSLSGMVQSSPYQSSMVHSSSYQPASQAFNPSSQITGFLPSSLPEGASFHSSNHVFHPSSQGNAHGSTVHPSSSLRNSQQFLHQGRLTQSNSEQMTSFQEKSFHRLAPPNGSVPPGFTQSTNSFAGVGRHSHPPPGEPAYMNTDLSPHETRFTEQYNGTSNHHLAGLISENKDVQRLNQVPGPSPSPRSQLRPVPDPRQLQQHKPSFGSRSSLNQPQYSNSPTLAYRHTAAANQTQSYASPPPYPSLPVPPNPALPPSQMSSLPDYRPVYAGSPSQRPNLRIGISPSFSAPVKGDRDNGLKERSGRENGRGGARENGWREDEGGRIQQEQYGRNWPPVSYTPENHHLKKVKGGVGQKGRGGGVYEPSGDEMSTEL